jgi:hypothetical protein
LQEPEPEPVYANVNAGLALDIKKQQDFVHSIQQQTEVALRRPHTAATAEGRPRPPAKPVRNSILLDRHHFTSIPTGPSGTSHVGTTEHQQRVPPAGTDPPAATVLAIASTPAASRSKVDEKENLPSTSKKSSFLFTPLRRTAFKKIGDRKLIRLKKKSLSPGTPKPSFKRIGNKKLIRIRDSLTGSEAKTPGSPLQVYEIKTKTKLVKTVKNTPSNASKYRFSFITPLSVRKLKLARGEPASESLKRSAESTKKTGGSFANRFKLDRRPKAVKVAERSKVMAAAAVEPAKEKSMLKRSSQSRLKKLSGSTYHVR